MATTTDPSVETVSWHSQSAADVAASLDVDIESGLDPAEVERRLQKYGPNELPTEPPPSVWMVARGQLSNPMNIMLLIVAVASVGIQQFATAIVVFGLVAFNVIMGSKQELNALASVEALAQLQVPHARVRRGGRVDEIESTGLVPGDVLLLEAGDLVPADARLAVTATLELQEAALTGESAPVAKDAGTVLDAETALGDRINLVFQNTQVTRGTATAIVVATGTSTQMGQIANMVTSTKRSKSPLQEELDSMTKVFGTIAWLAVGIIAVVGLLRGEHTETLLLLCVSTGIASIPTGLPTFVQAMLSSGAQRLAEHKAVVKTLTDVETLGGTTAINSDKTGTLTLNAMTVTSMFAGGTWYQIEGGGYSKTGAIRGPAGADMPDFKPLALGLSLCSDATVSDDGAVIGDPTEAALVVLAAKMDVDAEETRGALPRLAEVPFDSAYKYMATFHDRQDWMSAAIIEHDHFMTVKGAPDIVIGLCSQALWHGKLVPIEQVKDELLAANRKLSEQGLRVLAFGAKDLDDQAMQSAVADPMAAVTDQVLVALVGIIDPLREEAKDAVSVALSAGVDVRMITGDHTITARAIADQLGLGPGVMTGAELAKLSDDDLKAQLPNLHVFGRVTPEDKLRLAKLMQENGDVVAMTGDAVNDAAALKQADVGVAMGSGSEVTKQAAKIVLTDDNFATLVRAVDLGRDIYRRISSYVKLQLTILSSVLQLMVLATIFNINDGVALFPMQLLFCKFFVVVTVVIGFVVDVPDPSVMQRPPRKPGTKMVNRPQIVRWVLSGFITAVIALSILEWGPDNPSTKHGTASMTMAFAVVALSAVNLGLVMRREREPAWSSPVFPYLGWIILGWTLTWAAVELNMLQRLLDTVSLTGARVACGARPLAGHAAAGRNRQDHPAAAGEGTQSGRRRGGVVMAEDAAAGGPGGAATATTEPTGGEQSRQFGLNTAIALIVGSIIGVGIFNLPTSLAAYGPITLISMALTTVGALALALLFAALSRRMPADGGPYAYSRVAFGNGLGFANAWSYWITAWAGNAAIAVGWVLYVEEFVNKSHTKGWTVVLVLIGLWIPAAVNLSGVKNMGSVQVVTTVIKFAAVGFMSVVGLFYIDTANYHPWNVSGDSAVTAVGLGMAIALFSYLGVETAAVAAAKVKDPDRNVPRATIFGTLATAVVYMLSLTAVFGILPSSTLAASSAPFSDAANAMFGGTWTGHVMALAVIVSGFGALVGWTMICAEMPLAAANDGLFPQRFKQISKAGVPAFGIISSTVLASIAVCINYVGSSGPTVFTTLVLMTGITAAIPYGFSALAQLKWRWADHEKGSTPHLVRDLIVAGLSVIFSILFIYYSRNTGHSWFVYWAPFLMAGGALLLGIPVYQTQRSHMAQPGEVPPYR